MQNSVIIQNQRIRYIFWLNVLWDNMQRPLISSVFPDGATFGNVQLTSVGKTWQNGLGLVLCSGILKLNAIRMQITDARSEKTNTK